MVNPVSSSSLVGTRGRVVCAGNKALTFLPSSGTAGNSNAAVVLYEDRSTAGFAELAGNSDYRIYKNGSPATRADLRRYDVATYNAETNSILVCDTRVPVYYEACDPSPAAPTKLQVLGGTELYVLPTARDSVAQFKPGQQMTLLLTADGRVAGAVTSGGVSGNAVGVVSETGGIQLLCGSTTITLAGSQRPNTTVRWSGFPPEARISSACRCSAAARAVRWIWTPKLWAAGSWRRT